MPPRAAARAAPALPDLTRERRLGGVVAGVDEVGRAPLAGPVLAAAVILPADADRDPALAGIDDSKRLAEPVRERLAAAIRERARFGLGAAGVAEIERHNILRATLLAMRRAVAALRIVPDAVLVDGTQAPDLACRTVTVVGGDRVSLSIAAASIVAKVARDRLMRQLDRRHPGYGWASNAGYPTEDHVWGLLRLGACRHHRAGFAPLPQLRALPGLGLRFGPLSPGVAPSAGLRLVPLRADLVAVADGAGNHLGALKAVRRQWRLRAVGYGPDGTAIDGTGPLAPWHGLPLAAADPALLQALLATRPS